MSNRFALPGFHSLDAPKEEHRVFANHDGTATLVIKDNVPLGEQIPDYRIHISSEFGNYVIKEQTVRTGNVVTEQNDGEGTKKFVLRIGPPCLTISPGTYTVRAMVGKEQTYFKSLTVLNHPSLP